MQKQREGVKPAGLPGAAAVTVLTFNSGLGLELLQVQNRLLIVRTEQTVRRHSCAQNQTDASVVQLIYQGDEATGLVTHL